MPEQSIVSRLEVNLSWRAWLKPFFIHPSVTKAAKTNMELFHEGRATAKQEKLFDKLMNDPYCTQAYKDLLLNLPQRIADESKASTSSSDNEKTPKDLVFFAWVALHSEGEVDKKPALTAVQIEKLLAHFKSLQDPTISFIIDLSDWLERNVSADKIDNLISPGEAVINNFTDIIDALEENDFFEPDELQTKLNNYRTQIENANAPTTKVKPYVRIAHIFQGAFLKTFGFDGFHTNSTEIVTAQGRNRSYDQEMKYDDGFPYVPFSLLLTTLLGLPNRLHEGWANQNWRTIVSNLFGGWDSLRKYNSYAKLSDSNFWWLNPYNYKFKGKRLWNALLFPVKLVIFAIKVATIPLKIALNILKVFAVFLPEVILNASGWVLGQASSGLLALPYSTESGLSKLISGIGLTFFSVISAPIHYAFRLVALLGTAMFAPEQSARAAWEYGRAINSRFGYIFGFLGATASVAITATLWAITLPLVFGAALTMFPALGTIITNIAQLPIVANTLATINGVAVLISGTLPAAFSTAATAISTIFGVSVSAITLAYAIVVAFIAAPVASIVSRIADILSNAWTYWQKDETLATAITHAAIAIKDAAVSLLPEVSTKAKAVGQDTEMLLRNAEGKVRAADQRLVEAELPVQKPYRAQTVQDPSRGISCPSNYTPYERL